MEPSSTRPPVVAVQSIAAEGLDAKIRDCLFALLRARALAASLCPSEVARRLAPTPEPAWRALLPRVRAVAVTLAREGLLQFSRRGVAVEAEPLPAGPLRIRRGPRFPAS